MKATLVHDEERFPVGASTGLSVRIYGHYRYIDAVNVTVDQEEDGVLYFDVPATLNEGVYGVEVKGKVNGTPWRTATDCVIKITQSTQRNEGGEAVPEGDTYDITMTVQLYKQQSSDRAIEEHNSDETSHPYILGELERIEGEIPTLPEHIVTDANYVHTDNNYTAEEKTKLADAITEEQDPTVPQWAKQQAKPSYNAQEVGALPNTTKYGSTIDLSMNSTTYVLTLSLKDQDGTVLNTKTVDLPIESVVVNGRYDAVNKKIVLTLQSGSTIDVPVGDLIAGLQTEITSVNMLDADLVDDTNSAHKFVTVQEKTTWNNKSDFSGSYNDLTDKPTIPTVPTNVSAFTNDAGYITKTVNDLVNYYLKSDTYTKTEVQQLISAIQQFTYQVVSSLPTASADTMNKIYLVPSADPQTQNVKDEYITIDNGTEAQTIYTWEQIGSTEIDLSGYYTSQQTDSAITQALNTALAGYTTTESLTLLLAGKQDVIDSSHKLSADLVDDTNTANKFTNATEKQTWNSKQDALTFNTTPSSSNKVATMADVPTTMGASGSGHKGGIVPDTPAVAGNTKFLCEDGTWKEPAGGSAAAYTPTLQSAPTSSTTTYTKDGQTVDFEIGQFARVANADSPSGYDMYQLYDLTTSGNITTAKWEKCDTYSDIEIIHLSVTTDVTGVSVSGLVINVYYNDATTPTTTMTTDANGMAMLSVPKNYKYKLVFPSIQGCKDIADVIHTATLTERSIEVEYIESASPTEGMQLTIFCGTAAATGIGNITPISDLNVDLTIDGTTTTYTTGSNGRILVIIPYGKNVTITAPVRQGYELSGSPRTIIATQSAKYVEIVYTVVTAGIYVVTDDGTEYTEQEFSDALTGETVLASDAKLIKVVTDELTANNGVFYLSIDMLATRSGISNAQWCSSNVQFYDIPLKGNSATENYYYDGRTASGLIQDEGDRRVLATGAVDTALGKTFTLGTRTLYGFLGSVGQWSILWANRYIVDNIIALARPNATYNFSAYTTGKWTSTQAGALYACWWTYSIDSYNKDNVHAVVPFFAF